MSWYHGLVTITIFIYNGFMYDLLLILWLSFIFVATNYDISLKMREFYGGTCLHLAAYYGTIQMAYLLLCKTSNAEILNLVDDELRTAAMCAVKEEKTDLLTLFIQSGADLAIRVSVE